jgi:hypothetical protein
MKSTREVYNAKVSGLSIPDITMQSEKMLTSPIAFVIGTTKRHNRLDAADKAQIGKKNHSADKRHPSRVLVH